jgi:hypothetical protein
VWKSSINGRQLHFRLAGINNQNFIMRDQETGSWWQQASGQAITGSLRGTQLDPVFFDELSFKIWKHENPNGRVLRPDARAQDSGEYASADWEEEMAELPVVTPAIDQRLEARTLVIGIAIHSEAKAYPLDALKEKSPVIDFLGGTPILIVVAKDGKSVRAFDRTVDDTELEFFALPDSSTLRIVDAETSSEWDFSGRAISGKLKGRELRKLAVLPDYWFDWKTYHPDTQVFD